MRVLGARLRGIAAWQPRTVRWRVLLLLLTVGLTPLMVTAFFGARVEREAAITAARATLDQRAADGAALLDQRTSDAMATVRGLASNPIVTDTRSSRELLAEQLARTQALYRDFTDVTLLRPEGQVIVSTSYSLSSSWAAKPWFREAAEGTAGVSPAYMAGTPLHLVVDFAAPVEMQDGRRAVAVGQIPMSALARPLDALSGSDQARIAHGGLVVVDDRGNLIVGLPGFRPLSPTPFDEASLVKGGGGGADRSLWSARRAGARDWWVIAEQEQAVATAGADALLARMASLMFAVCIAVLGIAFAVSAQLTKAARSMVATMRRVGNGELDQRLQPLGLREVDEVTSAFNGMAARLQAAQEATAKSEEWFRALVSGSSDVVWVLDPDGAVRYASYAIENAFGVSPASVEGNTFSEIVPATDRPRVTRALRDVLEAGGEAVVEHGLTFIGEERIIESRLSDRRDDLVVGGILMTSRDISDRKALEADVERAIELDRLKTEFVGLAAHELRTPLTGIYGFASLLLEEDLDEGPKAWLTVIHTEAERLRRIIDSLLQVSQIESGVHSLQPTDVDLLVATSEAVRNALQSNGNREVRLDMPASLSVWADRDKTIEVIENLVSNALKYSPNGGVITVTASEAGDYARLSVQDRGLGIPSEEIASLFQRFKRVNAPDRAQIRGTGLGLYMVKQLVEASGGTVEVTSQLGAGSTFTVTLPRTERAQSAA